jgi:hypothetical protein
MNEAIPYYEPGGRITGHTEVDITGKRFVAPDGRLNGPGLTGDGQGVTYKIKKPAAGGFALGVASHDALAGSKVTVLCDPGMVVPVLAGGALTAGQEVQADVDGKAVPLASGVALGRVMADCPSGFAAEVKLR